MQTNNNIKSIITNSSNKIRCTEYIIGEIDKITKYENIGFVDLLGQSFDISLNIKTDKILYNDNCIQITNLLQQMINIPLEVQLGMLQNYVENYESQKYEYLKQKNYINSQPLMLYILIQLSHDYNISYKPNTDQYEISFKNRITNKNNKINRKNYIKFVNKLKDKSIEFTNKDILNNISLIDKLDIKQNDIVFINLSNYYTNNRIKFKTNNLINIINKLREKQISFIIKSETNDKNIQKILNNNIIHSL